MGPMLPWCQTEDEGRVFGVSLLEGGGLIDRLLDEDFEVLRVREWDRGNYIDRLLSHSVIGLAPIDVCCVHRGGVPDGHRSGVGVARASFIDREAEGHFPFV